MTIDEAKDKIVFDLGVNPAEGLLVLPILLLLVTSDRAEQAKELEFLRSEYKLQGEAIWNTVQSLSDEREKSAEQAEKRAALKAAWDGMSKVDDIKVLYALADFFEGEQ